MSIDVNKPVENPKLSMLLKECLNADDAKLPALQEQLAEELAMKERAVWSLING